jgi:lon-related putative ATP-dependent protease
MKEEKPSQKSQSQTESKKDYFGKGKESLKNKEWDWENFESTKDFPVSDNLLDWVVGQDNVLAEVRLALDEWLYKLKTLQSKKWYEPWLSTETEKVSFSKVLTPGPYLLLLGDPGTGKSLIGRAMAEYLTQVYEENKIERFDVLCWKNKLLPGQPKITIHPGGEGVKTLQKEAKRMARKGALKKWGFRGLVAMLGALGGGILGIAMYALLGPWLMNQVATWSTSQGYMLGPVQAVFAGNIFNYLSQYLLGYAPLLGIGATLLFSAFFIFYIGRLFMGGGMFGGGKGTGGAEQTDAPKLLVNNGSKYVPFIDATGHGSAQLFGSVAWDPYQTGGLGTPEHQRVTAGDVHRASQGILYIDEIKNLNPQEAITLLSVMEDGAIPIAMRSSMHGADTAAMAVSTEPIPALFFLLAAGNFDSIGQIHPALMDRLTGYGRVIRMNNDMPNTIENRRKYVQFISQESKRFNLPSFSRDACIEITEEGRRRSGKRECLTTKFRPLISVIKTAGTLAQNQRLSEVGVDEVKEAINKHCKTIQLQILEHQVEESAKIKEIDPHGAKLGTIYGLAVTSDPISGEATGNILKVKGQLIKKDKCQTKGLGGYYKVSGIAKNAKWITDSAEKVRSVLIHKYGVDIAQEYFTHIDFSQNYGIDGPSAGVTMALVLCSLIEGKPIRQDVCVTGEINISSEDEVAITAVGGVHEKIKAAEANGFRKVVIPAKNFKHSIKETDYNIEVVGAKNLDEYLKEVLDVGE